MNVVDISVAEVEPPDWIDRLEGFSKKVLDYLQIDGWEVSILLCDDRFIQDLNKRFRDKDEPTDVLSFAQWDTHEDWNFQEEEGPVHSAGDIVISLETLAKHAETFSVPEEVELKRLVIHGLLHLKGLDHADNSPEQEMLKQQESILQDLMEEKIF